MHDNAFVIHILCHIYMKEKKRYMEFEGKIYRFIIE